jgi:superoxide dismutase
MYRCFCFSSLLLFCFFKINILIFSFYLFKKKSTSSFFFPICFFFLKNEGKIIEKCFAIYSITRKKKTHRKQRALFLQEKSKKEMLSKFFSASFAFAIVCIALAASTSAVFIFAAASNSAEVAMPTINLPPLHFGLGSLRPHLTHEQLNLHYNAHQNGYVTFLRTWMESAVGETADAVKRLVKQYQNEVRAAEVQFVQNTAAQNIGDVNSEVFNAKFNRMNQSFVTFLASNRANLPVGSKHRNFAGQVFNHALYFSSLTEEPIQLSDFMTAYQSTSPLAAAIKEQFGSAEKFSEEFEKTGLSHFASGWIWLGLARDRKAQRNKNKLFLLDSHDAETFYDKLASVNKITAFSLDEEDKIEIPSSSFSEYEIEPLLVCDVWEHAYYVDYRQKRADYIQAWLKVVDWKRVDARFSSNPLNIEVRPYRLSREERAKRLIGQQLDADKSLKEKEELDGYPHFV